jgi:hypothetical protein
MATLADYEAWKAKHPINPADYPIAHVEHAGYTDYAGRALAVLLVAIAAYFLARWAARNAKPAFIYALVQSVIGWKAASRFFEDVGQRVKAGVAEHDERARSEPERKREIPGRFSVAGRFFFNVAIAPLLLGFVVIGLIWVAGLVAGISSGS